MAYASLLHGSGPTTLDRSPMAQHRQTWKLREHHLLADDADSVASESPLPLGAGDSLKAYFPSGTRMQERSDGVEVLESHISEPLHYQRARSADQRGDSESTASYDHRVRDIIITGEVNVRLCCAYHRISPSAS